MKSDAKKSVRNEEWEPKASQTAAPVFIFVVFALLLYWGALHIDKFGGGFERQVYAPYTSTNQLPVIGDQSRDKGRTLYAASCAPCHQANGNGLAGQNPPLNGSEWVLADHPARIIRIVLDGAAGPMEVKGAQYNSVMIPWRETMSDEDIAAVLTYIRSEWSNKAAPVTPEEVKAVRDETAGRSGPWTEPELKQIPDKK